MSQTTGEAAAASLLVNTQERRGILLHDAICGSREAKDESRYATHLLTSGHGAPEYDSPPELLIWVVMGAFPTGTHPGPLSRSAESTVVSGGIWTQGVRNARTFFFRKNRKPCLLHTQRASSRMGVVADGFRGLQTLPDGFRRSARGDRKAECRNVRKAEWRYLREKNGGALARVRLSQGISGGDAKFAGGRQTHFI